jgi:ketosteroid isomerase-like protein
MTSDVKGMERPIAVIERLLLATNQHDLDALSAGFAEDYENQTPTHPARGFNGRAQVRRNWEQIFAFVPDIGADVLRSAVDNNDVWTEWEMRGTRRDGTAHLMRGVVVFSVSNGVIRSAHFYLEPVDTGDATVNDAVRQQVVR